MKNNLLILLLIFPFSAHSIPKVDSVLVIKSDAALYLKSKGRVIKKYRVSFGANPKGHKQQIGDERTPEGRYFLDYKNDHSAFHKSIHISYPNQRDKRMAQRHGVNPGGDIMLHGQKNGFDLFENLTQRLNWTDGCIALGNKDMDELWRFVKVGTPIVILP